MRKISFFITAIATLAGFASCQKVELTQKCADPSREIVVEGEIVGADAKTKGLALVALPDWRNTQEDYIHLFEDGIEGTSPKMEISSSNNRIAYFSATFDSIFEGKDDVYHTYTAVIAPRQGDVYSVPAVQYPDEVSLIDPAADFLIGGPKMAYTQDQYTKFKIDFVRPVSVFRLCFVNLPKGEKIQEVVLNAETPLTGEVVMDDIFFERGLALFDMADGSKSITLKYNDAEPQTIFYAYFVCCPTSTKISSIVVKTDQNTYTKQTAASIKFTSTVFQSIAVDMNNNTEPETEKKEEQTLSFTPSSLSFEIGGTETFTEPSLTGAMTSPVSYFSKNPSVADVDATTGKVTFKEAGEVEICAVSPEDETYYPGFASYTVTVTKAPEDPDDPNAVVLNRVSAVQDGGMYVMVNNGKALQNNSGAFGAVDVKVSEDKSKVSIASSIDLEKMVWTWTASSLNAEYGEYVITNGTDYLYVTGSYNDGYVGNIGDYGSTDVKYVVWRYKESQVQNGSTNAQRYLTFKDGWEVPSEASSNDTYLFEYVDPRTPQTLSFSQSAPQMDLASSSTFTLTVSGAQTGVTYSSSDETVATVSSTGVVTALKRGTVTITATAAASAEYQGASASYTLTIIDSHSSATKFYKVTPADIVVGNAYLIVSNGMALKNDNGSVAAIAVTDVSGVIELDDYDAVVWTAGNSLVTDADYPGYTYSNGGDMLNRKSGDIQLAEASNNKYYNFAYKEDSGKYTFMCGTHYYTGYDSGWKAPTSKAYVTLYCSVKPKSSRELAFAEASVSKKLGDASFTNALSGVTTGVTYSSSNTAVATVNASTGAVTIGSTAGTTTITATAEADATYAAGTASYVLTVTDPNVKVTTYTKITSLDDLNDSDTYIIVNTDGNKAFAGILDQDGSKFVESNKSNAVDVTSTDDVITSNDLAACELKFLAHPTAGKYHLNFVQAAKYLWIRYNSKSFTAHDDADYSASISAASGQFEIKRDNYYISYLSSNSYFQASNNSGKVLIYKKSEAK